MFAGTFDSFKRRAEKKNPDMEIKKLCTTYTTSEDFQAYWNVLESGVNDKLHICIEEEAPSVATFFIVTKKKEVTV